VGAKLAVDGSAVYTEEDAEIDGCPAGGGGVTVGAGLYGGELISLRATTTTARGAHDYRAAGGALRGDVHGVCPCW